MKYCDGLRGSKRRAGGRGSHPRMLISAKTLPSLTVVALAAALGTVRAPQAAPGPEPDKSLPAIVFVEAPKVVQGELAKRFPQGSHLTRLEPGAPVSAAINLTPDFFAVADPRVSPDGSKILFSGQPKAEAHWQIWEMNADDSEKRQITQCSGDCYQPAYLPRGEIVFTAASGSGLRQSSAIYVSKINGAEPHPITFGPGDFQVETVLRDGRILVSAESPLVPKPKAKSGRSLFVMNSDGTGLVGFRREPLSGRTRTGAEELDDGTVLFVERQGADRQEAGGELAWITPGALHNSVITPSQSVFWSARQLDGNSLIVAKQDPALSASRARFDLYTFDLERKTVGRLIYRNPTFSSVEAVPLEPHPAPRYYWSIVHPESKTGRVVCLNAYLSSDAPHERFAGRIARVRVLALEVAPPFRAAGAGLKPGSTAGTSPRRSETGATAQGQNRQQVLGEASVEADGSFYVAAPADRPIRFELLSAEGHVIHAQQSWTWVRPGEDHACLGCHANPALTAPNHWALALKRPQGPTPVGVTLEAEAAHH